MKVIVHDLESPYADRMEAKADRVIEADGKYAPALCSVQLPGFRF